MTMWNFSSIGNKTLDFTTNNVKFNINFCQQFAIEMENIVIYINGIKFVEKRKSSLYFGGCAVSTSPFQLVIYIYTPPFPTFSKTSHIRSAQVFDENFIYTFQFVSNSCCCYCFFFLWYGKEKLFLKTKTYPHTKPPKIHRKLNPCNNSLHLPANKEFRSETNQINTNKQRKCEHTHTP